MVFSDNLYSAADSDADTDTDGDTESFTDELSPTDGYFNANSVPNTLVADPTRDLDRKTTEDKVLIPGPRSSGRDAGASRSTTSQPSTLEQLYPSNVTTHASSQVSDYTPLPTPTTTFNSSTPISPLRNTTPFSPRSNNPSSPRSSHQSSNTQPAQISSMGAPPAYSPSATSSSPLVSQQTTYNTFESSRPEQGFPPVQPESIGRPPIVRDERIPLFKPPPKRSFLPTYLHITRETVRKFLYAALVLTVVLTIMASTLNATILSGDRHRSNPPVGNQPGIGKSYCSYATYHQDKAFVAFDMDTRKDLTIIQTTHNGDSRTQEHISTNGVIQLRRLAKDSTSGPYISIDIYTSDPSLDVTTSWDSKLRTLMLSTPRSAVVKLPGPHCISVEIIAYLPENAELQTLILNSITLSQNVHEDLKIAAEYSKFKTASGAVRFPEFKEPSVVAPTTDELSNQTLPSFVKPDHIFACRHVEVETESGSISGLFPLYDYLGIKSTSGSVTVGAMPHDKDPERPAPAELTISTVSGKISAHLPIIAAEGHRYLPPLREYNIHVTSTSGAITGSFYQGLHAYFETVSGRIEGSLLPVIGQSSGNTLSTHSQSGRQTIDIMQPIFFAQGGSSQPPKNPSNSPYIPIGDDDPYLLPHRNGAKTFDTNAFVDAPTLRSLTSTHRSTSGNMAVTYPKEWEGNLAVKVMSGRITVSGDGIKIIDSNNGWARKELHGRKGVERDGEGSSVDMQSLSGSSTFRI